MVTLACSPLELLPSDELELRSICITFMASVSQLPLGMLFWVEAFSHLPNVHQIRSLFYVQLQNITPCWVFPLKCYSLKFTFCAHNQNPFAYPLGPSKGNACMFFIKYLQDLRYNTVNCGWIKGKDFQILFDMNVACIHRKTSVIHCNCAWRNSVPMLHFIKSAHFQDWMYLSCQRNVKSLSLKI